MWANDALLEISGRVSLADLIGLDLTGLLADAGEGLPDAIARPSVQCELVRPSGRRPQPGGNRSFRSAVPTG